MRSLQNGILNHHVLYYRPRICLNAHHDMPVFILPCALSIAIHRQILAHGLLQKIGKLFFVHCWTFCINCWTFNALSVVFGCGEVQKWPWGLGLHPILIWVPVSQWPIWTHVTSNPMLCDQENITFSRSVERVGGLGRSSWSWVGQACWVWMAPQSARALSHHWKIKKQVFPNNYI